jgi:hypothetical protein
MLTFLFWNLKGAPPQDTLSRLAVRHGVDVLMLAECRIPPATVLAELNQKDGGTFHYSASLGSDIHVYARFAREFIAPVHEEFGLTVRHLKPPARLDILLAVVHMSSKLYQSGDSQAFDCAELARSIRGVEAQMGHRRTVLVGDINMNPFESGVIAATGLNAVMDRRTARRKERMLKGRSHPFFYNPMWGHFGDGTRGPPGTYYRNGSEQVTYFWNIFDQMLIRPELLDRFRNEDLHILETDGKTSFVTEHGRPRKATASDHLPVLFQLNL